MYNKLVRSAKKLYYEEALEYNKFNLKKTWQILKEATGTSKAKNSNIPEMERNGVRITDNEEISSFLNEHFTTIAGKIADEIHPTDRPPDELLDEVEHQFIFELFTTQSLVEIVSKMPNKDSKDSDFLSNNFVKKIINEIAEPLSHVLNCSLNNGEVPIQLKTAKVIPIFKLKKALKDEHLNPLFYRPISLLPIFSKILGKKVAENLMNFLNASNILVENQYGYQKKKSTFHPIVHLLNRISTSLNKGETAIAVFCDLQKAFDTCNPEVLLKKLNKMGLRGKELLWFKSYLENREQYVYVNGSKSGKRQVKIGVPQGSILGPILFLCYINDLPKSTREFLEIFADDTVGVFSGINLQDLVVKINAELQNLCLWFRSNQLSLHPEKTKFMVFSNNEKNVDFESLNICLNYNDVGKNDPSLIKKMGYINSESEIPAIKYLGVYIDPKLNFKYHIEKIKKTLSRSLYIIRKSSNLLSEKALLTLYYSMVDCHLIYCSQIYSCGMESAIQPLVLQQKKAIRLICKAKYNEHTEPLFKKKRILPLPELVKITKLQFMYDFKWQKAPISFQGVWITNEDRLFEIRNLRTVSNELYVPVSRLKRLEKMPLYDFPRLWNEIDESIKSSETRKTFTQALKNDVFESLNSTKKCDRIFCYVCSNNA
jgi:hypothetical protein